MKFESAWIATKYVRRGGKLRASRDPAELGTGSRLISDLVAGFYDRNIPQHAGGRLIDLGCGKAPLFGHYRDYVSEVTCVDWAEPAEGQSYLDRSCDLGKPLPFATKAFDTVILSDVLEHVPDPGLLWSEMARLLSPGGKLLMNTPFFYCLHEQPHDYYRFTAHALRRFAEANGFEVLSLEPIGGTIEIMTDIVAKHLQFVAVIGKPLARALQSLSYRFAQTKIGAHIARRTSDAFPLGYAMVAVRTEER